MGKNDSKLIYTQGLEKGILIGKKEELNGRMALVVKHHKKEDFIYIDDLMKLLIETVCNV